MKYEIMPNENLYQQQSIERDNYTNFIVQSTAKNKIIVAGPGTGKTTTFRKLLETKSGSKLALTFINSLASDLQKGLGELAESYTFHGYCKKLLHKLLITGVDTNFHYYPKLPILIKTDADLIEIDLDKFDEAFQTLTEDDRIVYYLDRGDYYNAVSHNDAVYRVLKHFQYGSTSTPSFSQVVVDEYQDFNSLEIAFIDELLKFSPVLIAGDDDQAIYNFKNASPYHIRVKSSHPDFEKFELPYCSRCPQVIVDAVHDITNKAKTIGKLQERIEKKYLCFLPDKEVDSLVHPKIVHASCSTHTKSAPYISKFIEREIVKIPSVEIDLAREKDYPCVLIAGPAHYTKQVYEYLKARFTNIDYSEAQNKDVEILEGYKILMYDQIANLGWRIILECSNLRQKADIIKSTHESKQRLVDILDDSFKNEHLEIVALLIKIKTGEAITETETSIIVGKCGQTIDQVKKFLNRDSEDENQDDKVEDISISIKITTINGSKGMSANYVFLIGMNNGEFPKNASNPTDNEICQLIVGLTRTRKKCYLISNTRFGLAFGKSKSVFIDWINSEKIDLITANAVFFRS